MVTDHERQALRAAILDWSHSSDPLGHLDTRIHRMLSALAPLVRQGDDMARELVAEFELLALVSDQPLTFWTMRSSLVFAIGAAYGYLGREEVRLAVLEPHARADCSCLDGSRPRSGSQLGQDRSALSGPPSSCVAMETAHGAWWVVVAVLVAVLLAAVAIGRWSFQ